MSNIQDAGRGHGQSRSVPKLGMRRDGGAQGPLGLALAILKGLGDTRADRSNLRFLRRAVDIALRDVRRACGPDGPDLIATVNYHIRRLIS